MIFTQVMGTAGITSPIGSPPTRQRQPQRHQNLGSMVLPTTSLLMSNSILVLWSIVLSSTVSADKGEKPKQMPRATIGRPFPLHHKFLTSQSTIYPVSLALNTLFYPHRFSNFMLLIFQNTPNSYHSCSDDLFKLCNYL